MADTIRQQIRDCIIHELNIDRPLGIPEATKRRWYPSESNDDLSVSVVFMREPTEPIGGRSGSLQDRKVHIGIQCVAGTPYREYADDMLEPALQWVTSIMAGSVTKGLATDVIEIGTEWEQAKMEKYYLAATLTYAIRYQTVRNDLTSVQ